MDKRTTSVLVNLKFEKNKITNFRQQEHLGIGYIAANTKKSAYPVEVINAQFENLTDEMVIRKIKCLSPRVIGLSLYEMQLEQSIQFLEKVKELFPLSTTVVGGHYASFNFEALLTQVPAVDIVIRGEGENSFPSLLREIYDGIIHFQTPGVSYRSDNQIIDNGFSKVIRDLNTLPYPRRKGLNRRNVITNISASRGCPGACSFCSTVALDKAQKSKRMRVRDPKYVVDEIEYLVKTYDAYHFFFTDDNFIATDRVIPGWITCFSAEIERRKLDIIFNFDCRVDDVSISTFKLLKKAGLIGVFLGVESNSEKTLKLYNKQTSAAVNAQAITCLRKLRIPYWIGNIMFHPMTTLNDVIDDINFFSNIGYILYFNYANPVSLLAGKLNVYKGTPIYHVLKAKGLIRENKMRVEYSFEDPLVKIFYCFVELWQKEIEKFSEIDTVFLIEKAHQQNKIKFVMQLHILSRKYMKLDFHVFKQAVYYIIKVGVIDPETYFKKIISKYKNELDMLYQKIMDIKLSL